MSSPGLILATDLDGTFLGGSDSQRRRLYDAISARPDALLVFVTGRDLLWDFANGPINGGEHNKRRPRSRGLGGERRGQTNNAGNGIIR